MARVSLSVLGGFSARSAGAKPIVFPTKKSQGLLAYLALRPGHAHSRERLATLLWGDRGEEQARQSLRQALFDLRDPAATSGGVQPRSQHAYYLFGPTGVSVAAWEPHVRNFAPNVGHDYGGRLMAVWLDK